MRSPRSQRPLGEEASPLPRSWFAASRAHGERAGRHDHEHEQRVGDPDRDLPIGATSASPAICGVESSVRPTSTIAGFSASLTSDANQSLIAASIFPRHRRSRDGWPSDFHFAALGRRGGVAAIGRLRCRRFPGSCLPRKLTAAGSAAEALAVCAGARVMGAAAAGDSGRQRRRSASSAPRSSGAVSPDDVLAGP